jgi:beta-glucosidase
VLRLLGDRVSSWMVMNEPWAFTYLGFATGEHAPGLRDQDLFLRTSHIVNLAQAEAVRAIRAGWPTATVGSVFNMEGTYPASDAPEDEAAAERHHAFNNAWFTDPLLRGAYPLAYLDQARVLERMEIRAGDMERVRAPLDVIGINLYTRSIVAATSAERGRGTTFERGPGPRTSMDWEVWPAALYRVLSRVHRDYGLPVYVTENGAAYPTAPGSDSRVHDAERIAYHQGYIGQLARAIDEGCDVRGYFAWSLMDNFEWAAGYSQRFGLVFCDFGRGQERTIKDSGLWYRDLIAAREIEYDEGLA